MTFPLWGQGLVRMGVFTAWGARGNPTSVHYGASKGSMQFKFFRLNR